MKILARVQDGNGNRRGAIIEVSQVELAMLVTGYEGSYLEKINAGATLAIDKKFEHSQRVIHKAHEATKLPGMLRSLADTLDFVVPAIESLSEAE